MSIVQRKQPTEEEKEVAAKRPRTIISSGTQRRTTLMPDGEKMPLGQKNTIECEKPAPKPVETKPQETVDQAFERINAMTVSEASELIGKLADVPENKALLERLGNHARYKGVREAADNRLATLGE